jgi:hypothetical protein
MADEPPVKQPIRYGLRSLLMVVTIVALAAGLIPFVPILLLLGAAVFALQCLAFLGIVRLLWWLAGNPTEAPIELEPEGAEEKRC